MESIGRDAMPDFLKSNGILTNKQFGFFAGRSTVEGDGQMDSNIGQRGFD